MVKAQNNLDEFLGNLLRGVSKLVGCNSTNLIVINEERQEICVRIGVTAGAYETLVQMEAILGEPFQGLTVPIEAATDSLITHVWREKMMCETSELSDLIGSAMDASMVAQFDQMVGFRRYLLVPAVGSRHVFGVLLFEKGGSRPYSRQQREVLLRYARRIGEILESDLLGHRGRKSHLGLQMAWFLVDAKGQIRGQEPGFTLTDPETNRLVVDSAQKWLQNPASVMPSWADGRQLEFRPFALDGEPVALGRFFWPADSRAVSLEDQLLQLTMKAESAVVFLDTDFCITSVNPPASKLFAEPNVELSGIPIAEFFEEPRAISDLLQLQNGQTHNVPAESQAVIQRRDGSLASARVESLLLANDQDQCIGYLLLIGLADVDDRADATQRLVQKEQLATMGEMAAQLAHEIRNPLVAIGATLENLGREDLGPKANRLIQAASQEIGRMDMVLRKYLSVRHDLALSQVCLFELLSDVRQLLDGARRLQAKSIQLQVDPTLRIQADYDAMKHVFFNLIANALEASPQQGVVTCRAQSKGSVITIFIEDRGSGLLAAAAECMQPFFTTKSNGTGLGLPVCQKMVQAHGGILELSNRPKGGCQACIMLPARPLVK